MTNLPLNMHRYSAFIGKQVKDYKDCCEGALTNCYYENGKPWGVINDDYEVCLQGSVEIVDLTNGENYLRLSAIGG